MTIDPEHECEASDLAREDLGELLHEMKRTRPVRSLPMSGAQVLAMFAVAPAEACDEYVERAA